MKQTYDIFISYKRKSLAIASNLHYRFKSRGYAVFYDIEEMHPGEFDKQIYKYIDNASDILVIIEEHSLDGWMNRESYQGDWFYKEVSYALSLHKNIIPILHDCPMPKEDDLPADVRAITKLQAPPFSLFYIESFIDALISKGFIKTKRRVEGNSASAFKLYADTLCTAYHGKTIIGQIEAFAEEPIYWYVERKGEYRIKCVSSDNKTKIINCQIDTNEEKIIDIKYRGKRVSQLLTYWIASGIACILLIMSIYTFTLSHEQPNATPMTTAMTTTTTLKTSPKQDTKNSIIYDSINQNQYNRIVGNEE